jgi:hypothetical protein
MTLHRLTTLSVALVLFGAASARASLITVPIDTLVNSNASAYTSGTNLPTGPSTLTVGDIPFDLSPFGAMSNSLGVILTTPGSSLYTIDTDIYGATTIYTLINSIYGQLGATNGRVEFVGTGGAFASFDLIQGYNIRDYFNNVFNNVVSDPTIVTASFSGGVRLDRQMFVLPTLFATETLTQIRLVGTGAGNPQGQAFLAGVTVATPPPPQSVPEPSAFVTAAIGAGIVMCRGLRRRGARAIAIAS